MLSAKKNWKCTFNISGTLLEQLNTLHADEFFTLVQKLVKNGTVELTNSYMYHSLAPLTPPDILKRSAEKNSAIIFKTLGVLPGEGFFPPELALSNESLNRIESDYVIADESIGYTESVVTYKTKYLLVSNKEMIEVFRSYPNKLDAKKLVTYALENSEEESLTVVPTDVEVFGHHYEERIEFLSQFLDSREIEFITAHEAVQKFGPHAPTLSSIKLSSWQHPTGLGLWNGNALQKQYIEFARYVAESISVSVDESVLQNGDKGWSSCYLFWLSNKPWWYPDMVEQGAHCLIQSVRSTYIDQQKKQKAESLYYTLMNNVWNYHWSDKVEKGFRKHDVVRAKIQENLPQL